MRLGLGLGIGVGGGAASWTPASLGSTNVLWLPASSISGTADGATVTTFADPRDGLSVTQSNPTNRPVYTASVAGLNSKPALLCYSGGVYRFMTAAAGLPSGTAAHTLIVVVRTVGAPAGLLAFASFGNNTTGAKNTSTIGHNGTAGWFGGDDQVAPTGGTLAAATSYVISKTFSGGASGTVIGRLNGTQVATSGSYTFGLTGGFLLGGFTGTAVSVADAYVAEVIACDTVLSASDLTQTERYLGTRYGITVA